jgi:hypothetical protein
MLAVVDPSPLVVTNAVLTVPHQLGDVIRLSKDIKGVGSCDVHDCSTCNDRKTGR